MVYRILDRFLPDRLRREDEESEMVFRARIIVSVWLLGLVVPLLIWVVSPNTQLFFMVVLAIVPASSILSMIFLKFDLVPVKALGIFSTITFLICLILFIYHEGIIFSATSNWSSLAVVLAVFFVGLRFGFGVLLLMVGVIFHSHFINRSQGLSLPAGWAFSDWTNNLLVDQIFSLSSVYIALTFVVLSRKKISDSLVSAKKTVSKNARLSELGKVAAGIAHEVNSPLAIISGSASVLKLHLEEEQYDREKLKVLAERIETTCRRATAIVHGLRNMARDGSSDPMDEVSVGDLMKELDEVFSERMQLKQILFSVPDIRGEKIIIGRYAQLYQVFVNLINNSIDAIEDEDRRLIWLEIKEVGSNIELMVVDSGQGIPQGMEHDVLEPLFTTKPVGKGTGLGLPIVEALIREHGGDFFIDRRYRDSRMTVTLPLLRK